MSAQVPLSSSGSPVSALLLGACVDLDCHKQIHGSSGPLWQARRQYNEQNSRASQPYSFLYSDGSTSIHLETVRPFVR